MLLIFLTPQMSSAYDNDTHFWLTYYLAKKAGYTNTQATQIASANVGVDFDKDTEPLFPSFDSPWDWFSILAHHQNMRDGLHALPLTANIRDNEWWNPTKLKGTQLADAIDEVKASKQKLWAETLEERDNPGVFLHYLQDTFAHEGFTSYIGHAGYYYVDFLDSDRKKAEKMAFETLRYMVVFREALLMPEKEPKNFPDPESLRIEDLVSQEDILQIKKLVEEFCKVNPSLESTYPNDLVTHWNNLDEEDKRAYRWPPKIFGFLRAICRIKNGPVPDSSKARKVVQEFLNISESELPNIWLYNFNSNGDVPEGQAKKALVYVPYKSKKCVFTSSDEKKNTKKQEIKVNAKKQCLAFGLEVKSSQSDPFNCQ